MGEKIVDDQGVVKFQRVYANALPLLSADASALSTLPTAAFQFCEPVRTASSYGWYVFPPEDIVLRWTGSEVLHKVDGEWSELTSVHINEEFTSYWDLNAPPDLQGCAPPMLTSLFIPGLVQIWSGFFASTIDGWSLGVGPLANIVQSSSFSVYQAIVETDSFRPWPMFVNISLVNTEREIVLPKIKPLFQVRPIRRESYSASAHQFNELIGLEPRISETGSMNEDDWDGYRRTVRSVLFDRTLDDRDPGSYGAELRRKRKREDGAS